MLSYLNDLVFTLDSPLPLLIVISCVAFLCLLAFAKRSLDVYACSYAFVMGTGIFYIMRFEGFLLFAVFYFSSMILGKIGNSRHECRNWTSVMANGIMALLAAFIYNFTGSFAFVVMFASSVSEATSDTWAGEIGKLSKSTPVSILSFKPVRKGLSGGVTVYGFAGGFAGSLLISGLFKLFFEASVSEMIIVLLCGFTGCVLDSILGSSVQALYYNDKEDVYTEDDSFELVRGIKWVDNSMVNFLSNLFSVVLALGLWHLI